MKQKILKREEKSLEAKNQEVLLSIKDLEITFGEGRNKFVAVQDANFDIYKGETFSLVGESGSGKTTIGRAVLGLNDTSNGDIIFEGKKINKKLSAKEQNEIIRKIQMIFQDPSASLNERATVDYIISEGLYNFHLFDNEADRRAKVENMIERVGLLPEHLNRYPHEFSGGQRQRIGIARALIMEPELVVADEPISALDVSIRAQVLNLLKEFQRDKGVTYFFVAHDLSVVRFISDRIAVIRSGRIVELAEAEELFRNPLHPYTKALLSAVPVPDPILARKKELHVYDPSMHDYSVDKPKFVEIIPGHFVYGNEAETAGYRAAVKS
ncbi:ATP-binding cassette domain-containing protein [Enterococcus asini]|uniref:ATP-binding cassette domain-containing protein n=1 Tax=Enterococcus asini TaxID=57732 RepID=UPI0028924873|nr:ATP-binding cassette domain-containing protein [Enterococcus asini]MDT2757146.1 ATP-binding cassette domain-containing protein [Enterococcus asini]